MSDSHTSAEVITVVAVVLPLFILQGIFSAGAIRGSIGGAISGSVARAIGSGDHARASALLLASDIIIALIRGTLMAVLVINRGHHIYQWSGVEGELLFATEQ